MIAMCLSILLAGLAAGCGGGQSGGQEDQNGQNSQNSGGSGQQNKKKNKPETKIALGTIRNVKVENDRIVLRPSTDEQGEKPLIFKLRPKAAVRLDSKEAELNEVKPGQQAQIEYIGKEKVNAALVVEAFSVEGAGEETTD